MERRNNALICNLIHPTLRGCVRDLFLVRELHSRLLRFCRFAAMLYWVALVLSCSDWLLLRF